MLRYPETRSVKHSPRQSNIVTGLIKGIHKFRQEVLMRSDCQTLQIFKDECSSIQIRNQIDEIIDNTIPRIFEWSPPDQGESLTWWSPENPIHLSRSDAKKPPDLFSCQAFN